MKLDNIRTAIKEVRDDLRAALNRLDQIEADLPPEPAQIVVEPGDIEELAMRQAEFDDPHGWYQATVEDNRRRARDPFYGA